MYFSILKKAIRKTKGESDKRQQKKRDKKHCVAPLLCLLKCRPARHVIRRKRERKYRLGDIIY